MAVCSYNYTHQLLCEVWCVWCVYGVYMLCVWYVHGVYVGHDVVPVGAAVGALLGTAVEALLIMGHV